MENSIFDVIIIGGGPSGSTTATTLSRLGHSVLVLDKAKFPRDHVGESLLPFCHEIFDDLGVLQEMERTFVRKPGITFSNVDGSEFSNWCFNHVIRDERALSFHVRRAEFDNMLLENSRKNGAIVREQTTVRRVDFGETGDEFVTVRAADPTGNDITYTGRFVVDASGQGTLLARQMGTKQAYASLRPRVAFACHWTGITFDEELAQGNIKIVHLEGSKLGWLWLTPLAEDRLGVGFALNIDYANAARRRLSKEHKDWQTAFYLEEINSSPVVRKIIGNAKMAQPVVSNGDYSYYATQKHGDRYAIVGDASAFLDPIFASGIYVGMKAGQRVGAGISSWLRTGEKETIGAAYADLDGAYAFLEKLITTFYEPGSIRLSAADAAFDQSYDKFETAYSLLHLVLAGDFFTNHQKYIKAIELLKDKSMIDKYRNLLRLPTAKMVKPTCSNASVSLASV